MASKRRVPEHLERSREALAEFDVLEEANLLMSLLHPMALEGKWGEAEKAKIRAILDRHAVDFMQIEGGGPVADVLGKALFEL